MVARSRNRRGYSLIEVLAVMSLLVVLGGIIAPTIRTFGRDSNIKAGTDTLRGRVADARSAAIEDNRPYRLSISPDGTKIRVSPDDETSETAANADDTDEPTTIESDLPKNITIVPETDEATQQVVDSEGWVRVATFLPNGTCREDSAVMEIREPGSLSKVVRIRGLTATASVSNGTTVTSATSTTAGAIK